MTADTLIYARTAVAAPGYPTDLTPEHAALTGDGRLLSWVEALEAARRVTGAERHLADAWRGLYAALRLYVIDRGENPDDFALIIYVSNQVVRIVEARPGSLD